MGYRHKHFIITLLTILGLLIYNLFPYPISVLLPFNHLPVQAQTQVDQKSVAISHLHEAEDLLEQGDSQAALDKFQQILEQIRGLNQPLLEAKILNLMGYAYNNLGQYQAAEQQFLELLKISIDLDNLPAQGTSYTNLGSLYQQTGKYSEALSHHQKALKIFEQLKDIESSSSVLSNLGVVYQNLGQSEEALRLYQQALTTHSNPQWQAVIKSNIASVLETKGKLLEIEGNLPKARNHYRKALREYQEALDFFEQEGNDRQKGRILNLIGSVQNQLQHPQKALYSLHRALEIRRTIQDRPGELTTLNHFGTVYRGLAEYETALDYYNQALEIARSPAVQIKPEEARILSNIGVTLLKMGRYSEAADALTEAVDIWESLRPGMTDENKVSWQEQQAQTYAGLQEALVHRNQVKKALEISERGRARAFVELIASSLKLPEVESYQKPSPPPLTFIQMQEIARRQQATLVEYSYVNQGKILYIWVIQPDGTLTFRAVDVNSLELIEIVPAADTNSLERGTDKNSISDAQRIARRRQQRGWRENKRLYKLLIEPIVDLLPTDANDHVIFMPQADLFEVAFPALQNQQGQYLIEKHTILISPSIQVLDLTEQKRTNLIQQLDNLIVGNPKMPIIPLQPQDNPQPLSPLPGTEKEANAIAELLKTQAIIGEQATEDFIFQKMPTAKTIHFATHGLLDEVSHLGLDIPGALAFTPAAQFDEETAYHNGLLTAKEILDLQLNAELVVLSACNTGRGKITSDGVIGLSRAFISAGVPSIVVSLWLIPDGPSADLMIEFYHQMQQTPDKAIALRHAMLKTMKDYPDPQDWAAFMLIGQAD
ncbi:MAG: CHAT domain-containing tetratricopeptide repeat protein [Microcoleaceae cyanobacterium]